jgi:hypothetical protein
VSTRKACALRDQEQNQAVSATLAINLTDDAGKGQVSLLWTGAEREADLICVRRGLTPATNTVNLEDDNPAREWVVVEDVIGSPQLLAELVREGWRMAIVAVPVRWTASDATSDARGIDDMGDLTVIEPHRQTVTPLASGILL